MHTLLETPIAAPPHTVLEAIRDFSRYPEWNPFTPQVTGTCAPGEVVLVTVQLDGKPFAMKRRVLAADQERGFVWEGAEWYSFLMPGARAISCRDDGQGGTVLVDDERIGGLSFLMPARMQQTIRRQQAAFAAGLKAHVESGRAARRA